MTDPQLGMLMLGILVLLILLGFPIAFTLISLALFFGYMTIGDIIFTLLVQRAYGVMSNDVLIAVPLFLFMGYVVERANIVSRLFYSLQIAARNVPSSLAVASLATCAMFATATGIVGAVVTLMGLLALPAMLNAGYDKRLASGVICAGGTLGILIPPSIMLILYGAMAGVSVVRLYAAALLPGLLLAGLYIIYVMARGIINPQVAPRISEEQAKVPLLSVYWQLLTSFVPLAVLILAVLGSILFGLATPHEAAGAGALGGLLLAMAYRQLTWQRLKEAVFLTARTTAMVCWLFVGAWIFSSVFSLLDGHSVIEGWLLGLDLTTLQFLIVAQLVIFLLGWPLEWTEIIIIFVPIFLPLLAVFDVNPLFFGVLVALNVMTSFMTPPMAMSAFYLKGIAPKGVELMDIFRGIMPFLFMVILAMVILYNFPQLVFWLPSVLYG